MKNLLKAQQEWKPGTPLNHFNKPSLEYIIESDELFVFDPVTDDDKCQIDLTKFKLWLNSNDKNFNQLSESEIIDFAIQFDQSNLQKFQSLKPE